MFLAVMLGLSMAAPAPATPTDLDSDVAVSVEIDTPIGNIQFGELIVLRCVVEGIPGDYSIQWQCSPDEEIWFNIDCHMETYEFVLNEISAALYYRVVVTCEMPDEEEDEEGAHDPIEPVRYQKTAQTENEETVHAQISSWKGTVPQTF